MIPLIPLISALAPLAASAIGRASWKNPYQSQPPSYPTREISDILRGHLEPYSNIGQRSFAGLENQYGNLINDPTGFMSRIGSTYEPSKGYRFSTDEAIRASNQAAAAGGMLGSPAQQASLAERVQGLAGRDYQNYLSNALGLYGAGLKGFEGLGNIGYGASSSLAENLANNLQSQYQGEMSRYRADVERAKAREQSSGGFLGGIFGAIPEVLGLFK